MRRHVVSRVEVTALPETDSTEPPELPQIKHLALNVLCGLDTPPGALIDALVEIGVLTAEWEKVIREDEREKLKPSPLPDDADHLLYSNYIIRRNRPARYVPGETSSLRDDCECPNCRTLIAGGLQHGVASRCRNCGLDMIVYGNSLRVWRENPS